MEYSYFEVENFRGIQNLRIDFQSSPKSRCFALVGLNESGKTTILEAINHFAYKDENLAPLEIPRHSINDLHTLIPIALRSNFNGIIKCKIGLILNDDDKLTIEKFLTKELRYKTATVGKTLEIQHIVSFKNSQHDPANSRIIWYWSKVGIAINKRKEESIVGTNWLALVKHTRKLIPSILYFPTFLFDFPEKIYLEDGEKVDAKHKFYRKVLQDILDAASAGTNLTTHVVDRAKSNDQGDKRNLDSLLLEMGRNVTTTIFGVWNQIFKTSISQRTVRFIWDKDDIGGIHVQLQLEDKDGFYLLSERSLGFRWFFVFLLLTHYRGFRADAGKNVLFLLDEPASNLHASAQAQLLKSFEVISEKCMILYTTHSNHMIDPSFLDSLYVVKNEGLGYDDSDDAYSVKKTQITATKYRKFAANHPDQTNYFKPILDVLDYQPSRLDLIPSVIMIEGKTDFYLLRYFTEIILKDRLNIECNFLPGTGAGNLSQSIRLYMSWGRDFIVILDADKEGKLQKTQYEEEFGLACSENTYTLDQIDAAWDKASIEKLVSNDDRMIIQLHAYPEATEYKKAHFHRAIQEVLMRKVRLQISDETKNNFEKIIRFIDEKLNTSIT